MTARKTGLPCEDCGSSDALAEYDDHTHCFSCGKHKYFDTERPKMTEQKEIKHKDMLAGGEYVSMKTSDEFLNRGIDADVCEKFGVKVIKNAEGIIDKVVFPYYSPKNEYVAQKARLRGINGKGVWYGNASAANTFFGQQLWSNGKKLLVTEGEYDALAAYQIFGKKYPVVSIRNGADKTGQGVVNEFKRNFEYFRHFEEIILCFDNDEPGRASAEACAKVLPLGKTKVMTLSKFKDANEYLLNKAETDFIKDFWNARQLLPQDLVYGTDLTQRIIEKLYERKQRSKVRYPWEGLNELTYGIRTGEMVTLISGTGMGKSSVIGELMYHILKNTTEKIGMFMLEESVELANLRLASLHAEKPYHLPDTEWTEEELEQVFEQTIGSRDDEGNPRLVAFDHFGSNGVEELLYRVDHMVALGCKYIFLDHISIVVSDQSNGDERRALDEIATKLRTKVQEHDVALFVVSHLRRTQSKPHEEGGVTSLQDIRGTQAIAQLSDIVLGLERDGQNEDEVVRNTTKIRVLKNRLAGLTGIGCSLYYNKATGRLSEIKDDDTDNDSSSNTDSNGAGHVESKDPMNWDEGDDIVFEENTLLAAG
jgi:twinkle protein